MFVKKDEENKISYSHLFSFYMFHTLVKLCARKNTIHLKVENIENTNNTHIKQKKNNKKKTNLTSKCQQILPQWSSVDSVRKDR